MFETGYLSLKSVVLFLEVFVNFVLFSNLRIILTLIEQLKF